LAPLRIRRPQASRRRRQGAAAIDRGGADAALSPQLNPSIPVRRLANARLADGGADQSRAVRSMPLRIFSFLALAVLLLLAGGAVFLMVWEPKPPTHVIERTIPDDKLPR